jgi:hypothetical protein
MMTYLGAEMDAAVRVDGLQAAPVETEARELGGR